MNPKKIKEVSYERDVDILNIRINEGKFKESLVFNDIIIDINKNNKINSFEILNISKYLNIETKKSILENIDKLKMAVSISNDIIKMNLNLICIYRKKKTPENFSYIDNLVKNYNLNPKKLDYIKEDTHFILPPQLEKKKLEKNQL